MEKFKIVLFDGKAVFKSYINTIERNEQIQFANKIYLHVSKLADVSSDVSTEQVNEKLI